MVVEFVGGGVVVLVIFNNDEIGTAIPGPLVELVLGMEWDRRGCFRDLWRWVWVGLTILKELARER